MANVKEQGARPKARSYWGRPRGAPVDEPRRKPDRKYPNYIDPYPGEKRQPYHSPPIDPDRRVWEEPGFDPRFKPKPDAEQRRLRAFVRTEFQHPQFGRKLRPILRGLDPWRALDLLNMLDDLYREVGGRYPRPMFNPGAGWQLKGKCRTRSTIDWVGAVSSTPQAVWRNFVNGCLSGQAGGGPLSWMGDNARRAYVLADRYDAGSGVMRSRWNEYWERPSANTKAPTTVTSWTLAIDPNLQRHMPGQIATDLQPAVQPAVEPETDAAGAYAGLLITGGEGLVRTPRQFSQHRRVPPGRRKREGKVMSTLARIGISIFKVLDSVSEAAEVVDALYEALPEDVKKRWGRDRRPGDSFGQYGLEGADWKLEALYYNWSKVDSEQAVKNLVKNHLSDQVIGAYKSKLPKQTGGAMEGGDIQFAQFLDWLFDNSISAL